MKTAAEQLEESKTTVEYAKQKKEEFEKVALKQQVSKKVKEIMKTVQKINPRNARH